MKRLAKTRGGFTVCKLPRIVLLAIILSSLVAAIPAAPVLAADESLKVIPPKGEIGDYFYVEGDGFPKSDYDATPKVISEVDIYFSSEEADMGDKIDTDVESYEFLKSDVEVDDEGEFRVKVKVPDELTTGDVDESVTGGTYYVYVTYTDKKDIRAVAEFTVIAAKIELDPDEGSVGTEVRIAGNGFADIAEITIKYDGKEVDLASGDGKTDKYGEFACTILIPDSTAGKHVITVTDKSGPEAEAEFIVEPEISVTPTTVVAGDTVTVNGTGFGKKSDVSITLNKIEMVTGQSDELGSFEIALTLPAKVSGIYYVEAEDEENNKDKTGLIVVASIELSQTTGNVGTEVTVSGNGFTPKATVTISYDTETSAVATTATDADGQFSATFSVPKSKHGEHLITASDGTNTVTTTFTMELTPPPTPVPLIPQMWAHVKSQAYFNWRDVADPSGITYALQVATDDKFTAEAIVLEKTGLTRSEYTVTEEERLRAPAIESTYYWRIKAVDGAENEGDWTTPGRSSLALPLS